MESRKIEVALSTTLFPLFEIEPKVVVVIDVLRATTSICTALANGAEAVIPVASRDEARAMREKGYLVASERDGQRLDFAHFGNSPGEFTPSRVGGQQVVYCTTNGTKAITSAGRARAVLIGAFVNLSALVEHIAREQQGDVLFYCSGWKGHFNLEDTLLAGAAASRLLALGGFETGCDATQAAIDLWRLAEPDLPAYAERFAHRHRLARVGLIDSFEDCLHIDRYSVVPQHVAGRILPAPLHMG